MADQPQWIRILEGYASTLGNVTGVQVILQPSQTKPERFHVDLSPLPHPVVVGNGRFRLRLRAEVGADLPPTKRGISDALEKSLALAQWFSEVRGFQIAPELCGMAYHTALRPDDEMFVDGADDRSYGYEEFWLVELEFDFEAAQAALTQGA